MLADRGSERIKVGQGEKKLNCNKASADLVGMFGAYVVCQS